ncbi:hypothetical protein VKT23_009032 [Stygiomarasmius scandens]|uniref:Uncharacterized protein n=1 Tax=Marasmiellus scandens TaxID=2682957 RepID=A0ABR1JHC1_9AGAR
MGDAVMGSHPGGLLCCIGIFSGLAPYCWSGCRSCCGKSSNVDEGAEKDAEKAEDNGNDAGKDGEKQQQLQPTPDMNHANDGQTGSEAGV